MTKAHIDTLEKMKNKLRMNLIFHHEFDPTIENQARKNLVEYICQNPTTAQESSKLTDNTL